MATVILKKVAQARVPAQPKVNQKNRLQRHPVPKLMGLHVAPKCIATHYFLAKSLVLHKKGEEKTSPFLFTDDLRS